MSALRAAMLLMRAATTTTVVISVDTYKLVSRVVWLASCTVVRSRGLEAVVMLDVGRVGKGVCVQR